MPDDVSRAAGIPAGVRRGRFRSKGVSHARPHMPCDVHRTPQGLPTMFTGDGFRSSGYAHRHHMPPSAAKYATLQGSPPVSAGADSGARTVATPVCTCYVMSAAHRRDCRRCSRGGGGFRSKDVAIPARTCPAISAALKPSTGTASGTGAFVTPARRCTPRRGNRRQRTRGQLQPQGCWPRRAHFTCPCRRPPPAPGR